MPSRHYLSFSDFLIQRFGGKTLKVAVDAGFSCPNREHGTGGCAWCDDSAFRAAPFAPDAAVIPDIGAQVRAGIARVRAHRPNICRFLVYFQSFTNTYAPAARLRELYTAALNADSRVVGLAIGTRPDCVDPEKIAMLSELARNHFIQLEYGLQSINDTTLQAHRRGHSVADFSQAMAISRGRGIYLCAHVIVGLPGDTLDDSVRAADFLVAEKINGVKIHNLHIVKNTALAERYAAVPFALPTLDEYAATAARMIRRLPPTVSIQRLAAAPRNPQQLVAPKWCLRSNEVVRAVERCLSEE